MVLHLRAKRWQRLVRGRTPWRQGSGLVAAAVLVTLGGSGLALAETAEAAVGPTASLWRPAALIASLALMAWGLLRYLRGRGARLGFPTEPDLAVLATVRVAGKWDLALVQAMGRYFLVGGGTSGVQLIADVSDVDGTVPGTVPARMATPGEEEPPREPALDAEELEEAFFGHAIGETEGPSQGGLRSRAHVSPGAGGAGEVAAREREAEGDRGASTNRDKASRAIDALAVAAAQQRLGGGVATRPRTSNAPQPAPASAERERIAHDAATELALIRQRLARYRSQQDDGGTDWANA